LYYTLVIKSVPNLHISVTLSLHSEKENKPEVVRRNENKWARLFNALPIRVATIEYRGTVFESKDK